MQQNLNVIKMERCQLIFFSRTEYTEQTRFQCYPKFICCSYYYLKEEKNVDIICLFLQLCFDDSFSSN